MTIESLAESFREAKAKAGHPSRIKYPKKLKDAAIEYFKANPSLTSSASLEAATRQCSGACRVVPNHCGFSPINVGKCIAEGSCEMGSPAPSKEVPAKGDIEKA